MTDLDLPTTDLAEQVMFDDPFPRYAQLRREAPVSRAYSKQMLNGSGFMLTRYEDVQLLHNDPRFSSNPAGQGQGQDQDQGQGQDRDQGHGQGSTFLMRHLPRTFRLLLDTMVYKDDPDHARLRRLVNKDFTPTMVQEMSDEIERIVHELMDKLERQGSETVDLVHELAVPLPLAVISAMLGVDAADRDRFHLLMERFLIRLGSGNACDALKAIPSSRGIYKVLVRLADQRRAEPDGGMISALLAASEDGDRLNGDEAIAMIYLLMLAGHDTTANLIGSSAVALMEHPEQAERWRADPALAPSAVEELLRFTTPVPCGATRHLVEDVDVAGVTLPKGSKVLGMIISANRDESVFEQPDELDLGRDPNRHLSFAFGKHFCLGNQLARMEGQMAIGELVRRFPDLRLAVGRDQLR